jgi:beta-apo-4'-carotenal oxygenase
VLNEITSGGASVNDAYFHGSIPTLAFGGVGESGQGAYRGRASFDTFTHRRSVTTTPGWVEKLIAIRYPQYAGKLARYRLTSELKPNFDREGREIKGIKYWLRFLLGMGSDSLKEALVRWAIAAFVVVGLKKSADAGKLPSYLK